MHLTLALIICDFLSIVSAEPANDHLRWQRSHRKRVVSGNATVALNPTLPQNPSSLGVPSTSSNPIVASALIPSPSKPALSSSLPAPPLGTAPVQLAQSISPSAPLGANTTTSSAPYSISTELPSGSSISTQAAQINNGTGPPLGTGGLSPTAGSSGLPPVVDSGTGIWNASTSFSSNTTSLATGRPPLVTGSGKSPTGGAVGWNNTASNNTCGGCVVNAQAGLDWWYPMNVYQAIASISTIPLNGTTMYSLVPAQTSINVTETIEANGATFIFTETFDPTQNSSVGDYIYTTLPPPAAATTSVTTISDVMAPPNGTFGADVLAALYTDPAVPTFAIPAATGTADVVSATTNMVYYTAYEVETEQLGTNARGQLICQTSTATYQLPVPYPYEIDSTDLGVAATETGDVLPDFLSTIPQSTCVPGTWIAPAPVMIVVVEVTYQRGFSVFIVHHEVSDPGALDVPTATSDAGSAATSSAADVSVVQVVASVENTVITVPATVTGNPASVPITVGTSVVVASVIGGGSGSTGNPGSGGAIASAIVSVLGGGSSTSGGGVLSNIVVLLGGASPAPTSVEGGASVAGVGFASAGSGGTGNTGASALPIITVGGQTIVGNSATQFVVAPGQTLTAGGVATIGSNTVSLASGATAIVVNGVTSQIAVPATTPPPVLNIGGQVVTANAGGSFIVQGQTLTEGGQIVVGTNTVSLALGASSLVVNGQTITRPATLATATPVLTIDGTTFTAGTGGPSFIIGGQTLTQGGIITANGNTISLGSGASSTIAVVNGVTETLMSIITPAAITVGGTAFTELPGGSFVIQGQTLHPGSSITVDGTTLSLGPSASIVVINGQTSSIALGTIPAVVIGGTTYAATSAISGAYIIGGQTLTPGGSIVVNGHTLSLSPGDTALVIDGSTSLLNTPASITSPAVLTFEGHTFTANSGTFVVNGQTLTPGGIITVDGHTISLAQGATAVVIDGKTTTLQHATKTPNAVSAIASSTNTRTSTSAHSSQVAATTSKKSSGTPSVHLNFTVTFVATFVAFLGTICVWM